MSASVNRGSGQHPSLKLRAVPAIALLVAQAGSIAFPTATATTAAEPASGIVASDTPKAVERVADVAISAGPIHGTVHGRPWRVARAKISGSTLYLYPDPVKATPVLELHDLKDALHNSLGKPLLEKAMTGDKAALSRLEKIPAKPPLESARIAFDKEDGLLGLTKAMLRRADGTIYHCDAAVPLIVDFGARTNGKVPIHFYFRHDFGEDRILLSGHVDATSE